jgi:hypothetical protein
LAEQATVLLSNVLATQTLASQNANHLTTTHVTTPKVRPPTTKAVARAFGLMEVLIIGYFSNDVLLIF